MKFKTVAMVIYSIILKSFTGLYYLLKISNIIRKKKPIEVIPAIEDNKEVEKETNDKIDDIVNELNEKISSIKAKVNDNELKLIKFENNIKMAELAIKKYDYDYKMMEMKSTILNECAIIVNKIVTIIQDS
jgi:hypothetical protein